MPLATPLGMTHTTQTAATPRTTPYRAAALVALDRAIARLAAARELLASEPGQLGEFMESDTFVAFDEELEAGTDALQLAEDALTAAGEDYFGDKTSGRYRIGCLGDRGARLARRAE